MSETLSETRFDGSASRYTDSEYAAACVLDRATGDASMADATAKQRYGLPVANPGSSYGSNPDPGGVHAAAQRIGQVQASAAAKRQAAQRLMAAYRKIGEGDSIPDSLMMMGRSETPPRDELYRFGEAIEYTRDAPDGAPDGSIGVLSGHFAVFDQWTRIDSVYEGTFMERFSPGAFKKTFQEGRTGMRSLFQHGRDPVVGNKPLGPILRLEEDDTGAAYDVGLLDTSYNRDLIPGIQAGLYGASFRFRVMKQDVNRNPDKSEFNPEGIPERTVSEAQVMEFGPVTFPAYAGATAGLRSMTDEFLLERLVSSGRLRDLVDYIPHIDEQPHESTVLEGVQHDLALREVGAADRHSTSGSRKPLYGTTGRRRPSWLLETNS